MFESCTRNFSSLRNPHSRVPKFVFGIKETASPPTPLRMERGVKTTICRWRGRFVGVKKGSLHNEETPFSIAEGRLFNFKIQLPLFPLTILSHPTSSIHSPLHSERGRGWGCFLNSKPQFSLFLLTILSHPTSSFHSPLHSERGWGRGCSWVGGEAVGGAWGGLFLNKNNASDLCTHALLRVEIVTNWNLYCVHSSFKKSAYSCSKNVLLDYKY